MDEKSLPPDKVMIITRIEYMILNLYNDPEYMSKEIFQLIDEHKISEIKDIMDYFYELLYMKGYPENAGEFAKRYNINTKNM
ncbi:MAG: hypothetical protein RDU01_06295 [Thermodesulfovibrionales bacterium]|nr:hypothetical protein [Thermodesulfovibrionales bacterium]